jgi:hypothetical protein
VLEANATTGPIRGPRQRSRQFVGESDDVHARDTYLVRRGACPSTVNLAVPLRQICRRYFDPVDWV